MQMLTYLSTKNYRNIDLSSGLYLEPLNIFVGPNGSGKSNSIHILRFLQDTLTQPLADGQSGVTSFEAAMAKFGSGRIADIKLSLPNTVEFRFELRLIDSHFHSYELGLNIQDENTVTIRNEVLSRRPLNQLRTDVPYYYYQAHGSQPGRGKVFVRKAEAQREIPLLLDLPTNETAFWSIQQSLEKYSDNKIDPTVFFTTRRTITDALKGWSFYESSAMSVATARQHRALIGTSSSQLQASGENVVEVLHTLLNGESSAFEDDLKEAWEQLFPNTGRLRVRTVGRSYLELQWFFDKTDKEKYFTLDEMSDGTVRMLCWAVVLLSPKPPTLIVLDEPESALHPAWLQVLADWIRRASRKTQVIVSTHSPDLLDYFTDDAECVRVFEPTTINGKHQVVVRPLDMNKVKPRLEEGWKLGDLYRVKDPSIGGWPW